MSPSGERPLLQREAIIAAARELIVAAGLDALSLRRLASRLGVTAPALYAHVADKRDLLRAIAEQEFDHLVGRFEDVVEADPIARIHAYCRCYIDYSHENPDLYQVMFLFRPDIGRGGLTAEPELPAATKAFAAAAGAVIEAVDSGALVADDPLLVSLTLWSGAFGVASVLQLGLDLPPDLADALIVEITDRILHGYAPPAPA